MPHRTGLPRNWVEKVQATRSFDELKAVFLELGSHLGFDSIAYTLLSGPSRTLITQALMTNFPLLWQERYVEMGYSNDDAVFPAASGLRTPFTWSEIPRRFIGKRQRLILNEASDVGLHDGLVVPIHIPSGIAAVSAVTDAGAATRAEILLRNRDSLALLSMIVHEHALTLVDMSKAGILTAREIECVQWLAAGKEGPEIADILHLSVHTVTQYIKSAMVKLGANTRPHLVARAIAMGFVSP